jgi:hypothetical protein
MNPFIGIALALAALVGGGWLLGWRGVALAMTVIVFWLLLQMSRLMRLMKRAGSAPVGSLSSAASAVTLGTQLQPAMKLVELLALTGSLGARQAADVYRWTDAGGDALEVTLHEGQVREWRLLRAGQPP